MPKKKKKVPTVIQLYKAARKKLVDRLLSSLPNGSDEDFIVERLEVRQRCPYTCVKVILYDKHSEKLYLVGQSLGFSKCCWPDVFDEAYGIDLASKKAISYIVKENPRAFREILKGYVDETAGGQKIV